MKKIIILLAVCAVSYSISAQDLRESEVPTTVKDAFTALYPNETGVKWEKENGYYEAEFMKNSTETSVVFESNGNLVLTETEIPVSSLPQTIKDYVSTNLSGKKITEASKLVSAKGKVSYEAEVGKKDYLFDVNGNLLGTETDGADDKDDDRQRKDDKQ